MLLIINKESAKMVDVESGNTIPNFFLPKQLAYEYIKATGLREVPDDIAAKYFLLFD